MMSRGGFHIARMGLRGIFPAQPQPATNPMRFRRNSRSGTEARALRHVESVPELGEEAARPPLATRVCT